MQWKELVSASELANIIERSHQLPQVIFKHSTRCGTSSLAKNRLERSGYSRPMDFYLLDLIAHRSLSNHIAESLSVWHESPQVLLIANGECVYDESHTGIRMEEIEEQCALLINK